MLACPRCSERSYEVLKTHACCSSCNYSPTLNENYQAAIPEWAIRALKGDWSKEMSKQFGTIEVSDE